MNHISGRNDAIPPRAPADSIAGGEDYGAIFPQVRGDGRGRQIEETWIQLFRALRAPVDTTMRAGLSAGDIAYRLGELVHNFFRTRGVTLTSFELRRVVVEVLDNYGRGWPSLAPKTAGPVQAAPPVVAPPTEIATPADVGLVRFVEPADAAAPVDWSTDGTTRPAATVIEQSSPLVTLEPRPSAPRRRRVVEPPPTRGMPPETGSAEVPGDEWIDLPGGGRRRETLSPSEIARLEAAAADAATAVFGGGDEASSDGDDADVWPPESPVGPQAREPSPGQSGTPPGTTRDVDRPETSRPDPTIDAAVQPVTIAAAATDGVPPIVSADMDAKAPAGPESAAAVSGDALYVRVAHDIAARAAAGPPPTASRGEKLAWLRGLVDQSLADIRPGPDLAARRIVDRRAAEDVFGVGPIEPLLRDATASAVFVNGPSALFVERDGRLERQTAVFRDADHLRLALARLARRVGGSTGDPATSLIEGLLHDGSSVVIVVPPLATDGPVAVVRRRVAAIATLEDLVACETLTAEMAARLREAVAARANVLVCGPRHAGKTTLLGALARTIDRSERVVSVSEQGDARFDFDHVVALAARRGAGGLADFGAALAAAIRLRPGRLILDGAADPTAAARVGDTVLPDGAIVAIEAPGIAEALAALGGSTRRGGGVDLAVQTGRTPTGAIRVVRIVEPASQVP